MQPTPTEHRTSFRARPPQKGRVTPVFRRDIREFFGTEFWSSCDLGERYFPGPRYFGARTFRWEGTPLLCASFPHILDPEQIPDYRIDHDWARWHLIRPSLHVYEISADLFDDHEDWGSFEDVFTWLQSEWTDWCALPETHRLRGRIHLACFVKGKITHFSSPA